MHCICFTAAFLRENLFINLVFAHVIFVPYKSVGEAFEAKIENSSDL